MGGPRRPENGGIVILELAFRGISALSAFIAVFCALYVAWRAGNWRNSDERKAMFSRLSAIENDVLAMKTRFEQVATRSDVEALKSQVTALDRNISKLDSAVDRIEAFLMERGK